MDFYILIGRLGRIETYLDPTTKEVIVINNGGYVGSVVLSKADLPIFHIQERQEGAI